MAFKRILCPTDFSDGARAAMRLATQLGKAAGSELVLIHVWQPPYTYGSEGALMPSLVDLLERDAEQGLATWKAEAEELLGPRVSTQLAMGAPWELVVEAARKDPTIDLIVIGTHGRTGIKRVVLGSVAEKVVRHAPCPVLVVRTPQDPNRHKRVGCG